jgi:uncharacterized membrane protein
LGLWFLNDYWTLQLHPLFGPLVIFFFFQCLIVALLFYLGQKDKEKFPLYALGSVVFRLVSSFIALIVFFIMGVENAKSLSLQFMAVYLLFLVFELTVVLTNLRRN